jgi:hypothetical protein
MLRESSPTCTTSPPLPATRRALGLRLVKQTLNFDDPALIASSA